MESSNYFTATNKDLVLAVAQGNPGALEVTRLLQWFTRWESMMLWLKDNGYVGSKLWQAYKDVFHKDIHAFGKWLEEQLYKKKDMIPMPKNPSNIKF